MRTVLDVISDVRRRELPVSSASEESDDDFSSERVRLPIYLETLAMRLLPLRHIETLLVAKLVPPNESEAVHLGYCTAEADGSGCPFHHHHQEIFVRPGASWKAGLFGKARWFGRPQSAGTHGQETQDETQQVLYQLRDDMTAIWKDKIVRTILKSRKIRLEESPGL